MARLGVNGNHHNVGVDYLSEIEDLSYLGDGKWQLPAGYAVENIGEDNWMLTCDDGEALRVWTEEDA